MVDALGPLPLVTATFTTDELAKCSAGLMLLRKEWARRYSDAALMADERAKASAGQIIEDTTALLTRVAGMVSKEQGDALIQALVRDRIRERHDDGQ